MQGDGALNELFAKRGYIGKVGNITPLDVDVLALPLDGFILVPLSVLEEKCGRKLVEGLINATLPPGMAAEKIPIVEPGVFKRTQRYGAPCDI